MPNPNWFIALPVPAGDWLAPLQRSAPPGLLRPTSPQDLHLTVAFLGPVTPDAAQAAWAHVVAQPFEPFTVSLGGLQVLGRDAVTAALAEGRDAVQAFMARIRDPALAAAGRPPEGRPPLAHVTVGRARAARARAVRWCAGVEPLAVRLELTRIALYTWASASRATPYRQVRALG